MLDFFEFFDVNAVGFGDVDFPFFGLYPCKIPDKILFYDFVDLFKTDVAGNRNHGIVGGISFVHISENVVARERFYVFRTAKNRARQGVTFVKSRRRDFVRQIVGRVVAHCDFFQNNALFFFKLVRGKHAVEIYVRQNIGAVFKVVIDALNVITSCGF